MINWGNSYRVCLPVGDLVAVVFQEKKLKRGLETSILTATYIWGSGKNVLWMEGLVIQGLGPDSGATEEP